MRIRGMSCAVTIVLLCIAAGCSDGGETASAGATSAGSGGSGGAGQGSTAASGTGQGGMTGSGGGSPGMVHVGFGNVDSNISYDTFDAVSIDAVWNVAGHGSLTAMGPVEPGQCQQTVGLAFGGMPQPGNVYTLDATTVVPAGGKGYVTYTEACMDAGTHESWRTTMGTLTIDTVTGETVSFTLEGLGLDADPNVSPNDGMGSCTGSGIGTVQFIGLP